jgi:hypothetical protein
MYCTECGQPLIEAAKHCGYCGAPVSELPAVNATPSQAAAAPTAIRPAARPAPPPMPSFGPPPISRPIPPPAPQPLMPPAPQPFVNQVFVSPGPQVPYMAPPMIRPAGRATAADRFVPAGFAVIALVGSVLPFVAAGGGGGHINMWQSTPWGPIIGVLLVILLGLACVARRGTAIAAGLLSIPTLALTALLGLAWNTFRDFGLRLGAGFYIVLVATLVVCIVSFVVFGRLGRSARGY